MIIGPQGNCPVRPCAKTALRACQHIWNRWYHRSFYICKTTYYSWCSYLQRQLRKLIAPLIWGSTMEISYCILLYESLSYIENPTNLFTIIQISLVYLIQFYVMIYLFSYLREVVSFYLVVSLHPLYDWNNLKRHLALLIIMPCKPTYWSVCNLPHCSIL